MGQGIGHRIGAGGPTVPIDGVLTVVSPYSEQPIAEVPCATPADVDRGVGIAERVRTGTFGVNQGYPMDPYAPFGGVKGSGYGRELGPEGFEGYLETKSIAVAKGA